MDIYDSKITADVTTAMKLKAQLNWHVAKQQNSAYIWIRSNEVDETGAYYTEWSKPERKTPIQYSNTYIWNLERQ